MAEIDPSEFKSFKSGDVVLVPYTLEKRGENGWWLARSHRAGASTGVHEDEIRGIEPRPLAVGERVRWGDWVGRLDYIGKSCGVLTTEPNGIEKLVDLRDLERAP